jgi:hypothetical protein
MKDAKNLQAIDKTEIQERLEKCIDLYNSYVNGLNSDFREFINPMPEINENTHIVAYTDFIVYGVGLEDEFAVGDSWFLNDWNFVSNDISASIDEQVEKWLPVVEMN